MIRLPPELTQAIEQDRTVVVPSRQRSHAARLAHAAAQLAQGRQVWSSPDVLPLEAWLTREVERAAALGAAPAPRLLSANEEWLIWRECTANATQDRELLDRSALADELRASSALAEEFAIDILQRPLMPAAEAELLHSVQHAVDHRCRSLGAATLHQQARSLLKGSSGAQVLFCGFGQPSPRLRALGAVSRKPVQHLSRPQVVLAADEIDELEQIANWCAQQSQREPTARLLVVLSGGPGVRERLATLIRQAMDPGGWLDAGTRDGWRTCDNLVAIEGGGPLALVPVVAHALDGLAWLGGESRDFSQVSEWLRAAYWSRPHVLDRARLDQKLRESRPLRFDAGTAIAMLERVLTPPSAAARSLALQLRNAVAALDTNSASPRDWSERFRTALQTLGWPGDRVRDSREQQTVMRFHELLDEFGHLAATAGSMSRADALRWITELAQRTAFRPADDDAVVTISAVLADPVVHYDGIWIAGLHADVFPRPVQPDPFLPLGAQLARNVPSASAAARLTEAQNFIRAWRAATSNLILSVPARAQDLALLPSPLLAEWRRMSPAGAGAGVVGWLPLRLRRGNLVENVRDDIGAAWPLSLSLPSGTRSLELQNLCAFRAYAELRLGSSEMDVTAPGVARDVRGKLLHEALDRLWRALRDSDTLARTEPDQLHLLIGQCVIDAADAILAADPAALEEGSPVFTRECRRAVRLIHRLCDLERERAAFRVAETEFPVRLTLAGAQLSMRIDRLDELRSGGKVILDYKSGKRITGDWYGERPSHPQLLLYLAAVGADAAAMATVNVTAREVRFEGIARDADLLPKVRGLVAIPGTDSAAAWTAQQAWWRASVERLAVQFVDGRAEVDPQPGACRFCPVVSFCRIGDRGIFAIDELSDPEAELHDD